MAHIARLLAPPLAGLLMINHLLALFTIAHCLMLFRLVLIKLMPETLPPSVKLDTGMVAEISQHPSTIDHLTTSHTESSIAASVKKMLHNNGLVFVLMVYLLKRIAFASEGLSFQYASGKMGIALSVTAWLRLLNVLGAISAVSLLLPVLERAGTWVTPEKDQMGMRLSLAIAALGFFVIFFSRNFLDVCIGGSILN